MKKFTKILLVLALLGLLAGYYGPAIILALGDPL